MARVPLEDARHAQAGDHSVAHPIAVHVVHDDTATHSHREALFAARKLPQIRHRACVGVDAQAVVLLKLARVLRHAVLRRRHLTLEVLSINNGLSECVG